MTLPFVSIVNWNLEWRRPDSSAARQLRTLIWESDPDIVCLTECYADFLDRPGHIIESEHDYGYKITEGRRKVVLWSKEAWRDTDPVGDQDLPGGRFVRGRTRTRLGEIDMIGVCIPWSGAHVTSGQRNRARWEDHVAYLEGLSRVIPPKPRKLIVLGDYNQKVPRSLAPEPVFDALRKAILERLETPTAGAVQPLNTQVIDHLSHSADLYALPVRAISNLNPHGKPLTDHIGVRVLLTHPTAAAALTRLLGNGQINVD